MAERRRLLHWLKRGALGALILAVGAILVEHILETRDAKAATANDTFVTVKSRRVRYLLLGADQPGPTIVLLPGIIGTIEQWDAPQRSLSQHAKVLSYDRAGTGYSDAADGHDAGAEADELAAVLQAAPGAPHECVVVGYSTSGFLARVFVARYPNLAKGLVLIDPSTRTGHMPAPPYRPVSHLRSGGRSLISGMLQALFGISRLKHFFMYRDAAPTSRATALAIPILDSFHHWLAATQEGFAMDTSSAQANASPPVTIPAGLLSTFSPENHPAMYAEQQALVASMHGIFRRVEMDHSELVTDKGDAQTLALITDVTQLARAAP